MSDEGKLFGYGDTFKGIAGRPIYAVGLSDDKGEFYVTFQDGSRAAWTVEGDCCSHSWIEHLEAPNDVQGRTFVAVEDEDIDTDEQPPESDDDNYYDECLQVYQTIFRLDNGDSIKLEYRNTSNGYYGGYLVRSGT